MYSVNQVNQMYVVTGIKTSMADLATDPVGTLYGPFTNGDFTYYKYKGAGGLIATDRIKKGKVKWISYTDANKMRKPLKKWTIAMNSSVNSGNPSVGQDYVLNLEFDHYFGMSDEDIYNKFGSARAFNTTASDLLASLAVSLAKNFSREIDMPFDIYVTANTTKTAVTVNTKADDLASVTNIILEERVQPWNLGRFKQTRPSFEVIFTPIVISGVEYNNWGTVTEAEIDPDTAYIGNGAETADLEWFCMGERGDQYRGKDWPLSITTPASLLVDAAKEYNYLIVHFWDDIDNEGPQKSERDMTFVTPVVASPGTTADLFTIADDLADMEPENVKANGTSVPAGKVATPVITIDADDDEATITCATPGASIYYGADDSAVSDDAVTSPYSSAVNVSTNIYIKAKATKNGMEDSDIASAVNS